MKKKLWLKILIVFLVVLLAGLGGFLIYVQDYYRPLPQALTALQSSDRVSVEEQADLIVFEGKEASDLGLAFYPGGKVDFRAYAPLMHRLAEEGLTCVLLKVPFQLAVFDIGAANRAKEARPEISNWLVSGHSLGGAMAASFAADNSTSLKGIVLLAAYPTKETDLPALVLYGSKDLVVNREKLLASESLLLQDRTFFEIEGGNHAYFGDYGEQGGDGQATISRQEQQEITVEKIIAFSKQLGFMQ